MKLTNKEVIKKIQTSELNRYYTVITKTKIKEREIIRPGVCRTSLEFADNNLTVTQYKNILVWGTRECRYFESLKEKVLPVIKKIISGNPPLLVLSKGMNLKWQKEIIQIANEKQITVLASKLHVRDIANHMHIFLEPFFCPKTTIHGSLISAYGVGILLIGKSGIGKSEAVLELLQKGHIFIADDATKIKKIGTKFIGTSPSLTKDLLEVRGVGIINVKKIFGLKSVIAKHQVDLVVELHELDKKTKFDRLGYSYKKYKIFDSWLPYSIIPVSTGRNIASLIELSANVFNMKKDKDYVSVQEELRIRFSK